MIIEEFRTDSLMLGPIRISQLVALVTMLAAVAVLLVKAIRSKGTSTEVVTADGEASDAEALCEEAEENEPSTIFSNDEGENEECEEESDGENDSEADSLTANENTEDTTEDNKESTDGN